MRKGMFDYDRDGKLDPHEQAAEWQFIDEVVMKEDSRAAGSASGRRVRGEVKGISFAGKPLYDRSKDSNGVVILKSLVVIALCIGGFALPIALDMGDLGMGICLLAGPALSYLVLKNT